MKQKKNIERLFQEKFKDFEATPSQNVWDNIQAELNTDESPRKIAPVWWRYAGVAAILLLFLAIGNALFNSEDNNNPVNSVVGTENTVTPEKTTSEDNNNKIIKTPENGTSAGSTNENPTGIAAETNGVKDNNISNKAPDSSIKVVENSSNSQKENGTNPASDNNSQNKKSPSKERPNLAPYNNSQLASGNSKSTEAKKNSQENLQDTDGLKSNTFNNNKQQVAEVSNSKTSPTTNEKTSSPENVRKENTSAIAKDIKNSNNAITERNSNIKSRNEMLTEMVSDSTATNAVALTETTEQKKDSLTIEEAIAQAEDITEKEKLVNRWQVYASIAPVYYNTLGEGSHIDEQFVNNQKNGEVNTSYGVNVGYALNNKITLRTGVNSLKVSYDTAGAILYENVNNSGPINPLRNIDFVDSPTGDGSNISVISAQNLGVQQLNSAFSEIYNAAISQRISYFEVPLEVEYNVIQNKFNLSFIGGVSTFILDDNQVYSEFEERKTYIGEANNINDVSFSTNFGIGLGYNFSEKFKFNFQPTFKYQLNAYNNTSGNFNPYIVGVYTGFSYKF